MDDVFRFIHRGGSRGKALQATLQRTQWYMTLESAAPEARQRMAESVLAGGSSEVVRRVRDLAVGTVVQTALTTVLGDDDRPGRPRPPEPEPTVAELWGAIRPGLADEPGFAADLQKLSDTLLMSVFAPAHAPEGLDVLRRLYLAYVLIQAARSRPELASVPVRPLVDQPIEVGFATEASTARVRSVGIADLLVVKQHIKRYEAAEIAHVENIMPGETRSREHRQLERFEEMTTTETETTTAKEEELESTERFELAREASRTIKEDQKYSFDLNISGQYGPVIEFDTGFGLEITRSEESQVRDSTKYAKDVVQRSLERVKERVRQERIRRITREMEERNLHSFINDGPASINGIYQFIDKVYEAQVFNYGKRQMFDFMIPEPASYLWYLEKTAASKQAELPPAPDPLNVAPLDLLYETEDEAEPTHYTQLGAKYGATALEPPPPLFRRSTVKHVAPAGSETPAAASEHGGALVPPTVLEVTIPAGYRPKSAQIYSLALTDNVNVLHVSFGAPNLPAPELMDTTDRTHVGGDDIAGQIYVVRAENQIDFTLAAVDEVYEAEGKLLLSIFPFETANHAFVCDVRFERNAHALNAWKLETFEKLRAAHQNRMLEYKDEINRIKAELQAQEKEEKRELGAPPSQRRQTILTELKKHCIAILRQRWYADPSVMIDGTGTDPGPPTFDFEAARREGSLVRFVEHSFQWDQLQFAFYPYFWAREWEARFRKDDPDYDFQQFLQAGWARVVLAVRPGFERAVSHFLETNELWEGRGEPTVSDPLYRSIVDEIRDRADAGADAIPVGEPWEVRLPTSLILLRPHDARPALPAWQRAEDGSWTWTPVSDDAT